MEGSRVEEQKYLISDAARIVKVEAHVLRYWEEELELPPVELSDDLPADLSADPESDYEWHSGISEAMRAISDM